VTAAKKICSIMHLKKKRYLQWGDESRLEVGTRIEDEGEKRNWRGTENRRKDRANKNDSRQQGQRSGGFAYSRSLSSLKAPGNDSVQGATS